MQTTALRKEILVVEDEPGIRELCCRVLAREGHGVDTAADGYAAEAMLDRKSYELIIIDLRMPVVDGKQLYQRINHKYPELTRKVILTAEEGITESSFLEQSCRPFLCKPFTPFELKTMVNENLVPAR